MSNKYLQNTKFAKAKRGSSNVKQTLFDTKASIKEFKKKYKKIIISGIVFLISIPLGIIVYKKLSNKESGSASKLTAEDVNLIADKGVGNASEEELSDMTDYFEDYIDQLDADKEAGISHIPELEMDVFAFDEDSFDKILPEDELPKGITKNLIDLEEDSLDLGWGVSELDEFSLDEMNSDKEPPKGTIKNTVSADDFDESDFEL